MPTTIPTPEVTPEVKPPLKWAGGKRWLVPTLLPLWQPHSNKRLVEPFVGGMGVTLSFHPKRALLNDVNGHLINFYLQIQHESLNGQDVKMENTEECYYANRARFNSGEASYAESAALFYYLNRTGYNGLCRFNSKGGFNVPFGKYKALTYRTSFPELTELFKDYTFTCGDFQKLHLNAEDFIYSDPPYDDGFTTYSAGGFTWDDQVRTAQWLAAHPGPVVASNKATPRIIELYKSLGFSMNYLDAPRRISCDGNRDSARELLATLNL